MLELTAPVAAALGATMIALSIRVSMRRKALGVSLGDGGDAVLLVRMRAFGNFAEFVPLALFLVALAELRGAPGWAVLAAGWGLVAARLLHAAGLDAQRTMVPARLAGTLGTFAAMTLAGGAALLAAG